MCFIAVDQTDQGSIPLCFKVLTTSIFVLFVIYEVELKSKNYFKELIIDRIFSWCQLAARSSKNAIGTHARALNVPRWKLVDWLFAETS